MDAMPVRLGQEIGGWAAQIEYSIERLLGTMPRLLELATGGTAVGTGINAHPEFGGKLAGEIRATDTCAIYRGSVTTSRRKVLWILRQKSVAN
jgi:fumarate hydratase class II